MPKVHPTAILDGEVELADDVEIGPWCLLSGSVRLGPGCRLMARVTLQGPLVVGANNRFWPNTCIGTAPQSARFDPFHAGPGTVIGEGNSFREHVTIHRATHESDPTRIGDRNYFMAGSHAGHDVQVGNNCTLANGSLLGGHAILEDGVLTGGNSAVHQFCRVGTGAMISGCAAVSLDLMPHFTVSAINFAGSINMVGLRRRKFSLEQIATVRWVYKTFCRAGLSVRVATDRLRSRAGDPVIDQYIEFVDRSTRGLVTRHGREAAERDESVGDLVH